MRISKQRKRGSCPKGALQENLKPTKPSLLDYLEQWTYNRPHVRTVSFSSQSYSRTTTKNTKSEMFSLSRSRLGCSCGCIHIPIYDSISSNYEHYGKRASVHRYDLSDLRRYAIHKFGNFVARACEGDALNGRTREGHVPSRRGAARPYDYATQAA